MITNILDHEYQVVQDLIPKIRSSNEAGKKNRVKNLLDQLDVLVCDTLIDIDTGSSILDVSKIEFARIAESHFHPYTSSGERSESHEPKSMYRFSEVQSYFNEHN